MLTSVLASAPMYSNSIPTNQAFAQTPSDVQDIANYVVYGLDEVKIDKDVTIQSGNIGIHDSDKKKGEIKIKKEITFLDSESLVVANKIKIDKGATVPNVFYNKLDNKGEVLGTQNTPLNLPVVNNLPKFSNFESGDEKIKVDKKTPLSLPPGDYGKIEVKKKAIIIFEGGIYNIESIKAGKDSQILFESASEVRVTKDVKLDKMVTLGPHPDSDIDASDILFFVGKGDNKGKKSKIEFGKSSVVQGVFFSPNGEIKMKKGTQATGSFIAKKITIEKNSIISLDSASAIPIEELVAEYLALIEKLNGLGIIADELIVTQELIDEIQDDLDRIKQIVIELQLRGFDGNAEVEIVLGQAVGTVSFFNEDTLEILFEIQIQDGTLAIFTAFGMLEEFQDEDVLLTFEEQALVINSALEFVDIITNFDDEELSSTSVLSIIGKFHPSTGNTFFIPIAIFLIIRAINACITNPECRAFFVAGVNKFTQIFIIPTIETIFEEEPFPPTCVAPAVLIDGECVLPPPSCIPPKILIGTECIDPTLPPPPGLFFEDDYSSNDGWTQGGNKITVDDPLFPGIVKFNNAGGGGNDHRVFKQLPSALPADSWTAEMDYKFTASNLVNHYPLAFTSTSEHPEKQSQSGDVLRISHGLGINHIRISAVSEDSTPILLSLNTQYYLSLERSPTELVLSVFFDPARTSPVPESPVHVNILETDYTDLNFIQHSASFFSGGARLLTAEIDNTKIFDIITPPPSPTECTSGGPIPCPIHNYELNGSLLDENFSGENPIVGVNTLQINDIDDCLIDPETCLLSNSVLNSNGWNFEAGDIAKLIDNVDEFGYGIELNISWKGGSDGNLGSPFEKGGYKRIMDWHDGSGSVANNNPNTGFYVDFFNRLIMGSNDETEVGGYPNQYLAKFPVGTVCPVTAPLKNGCPPLPTHIYLQRDATTEKVELWQNGGSQHAGNSVGSFIDSQPEFTFDKGILTLVGDDNGEEFRGFLNCIRIYDETMTSSQAKTLTADRQGCHSFE